MPTPGAGEILVKVAAAGVNRPDVHAAQGTLSAAQGRDRYSRASKSPAKWSRAAPDVTRWKDRRQGDARSWSAAATPNIASRMRAHALPVPAGAVAGRGRGDPRDVLHRLAEHVRARPPSSRGETLLVHGGSSGIGTTAISWPRRSAPASSPPPARRKNARPAAKLGADVAVNYKTEDFVAATKKATGGKRRRPHPRHGRRRLHRSQLRRSRRRRAHRAGRVHRQRRKATVEFRAV